MRPPGTVVLRNARVWRDGAARAGELVLAGGRVAASAETSAPGGTEVDLGGRLLLPGLVNGHDHLDFSTFPPIGRPPYASAYEWAADVNAGDGDPAAKAALSVPLADRLFLGGLRNLLSGVTAVAHHGPYHRSLGREGFPVHVLSRYQFAHSPGLTPHLRRTYRSTDRRIPWMIHVAEGNDARCWEEVRALRTARLLRENTVLVHAIALGAEDRAAIAEAGASVVWCPESNRHLYGTTAGVRELLEAGVRVGLGSDSPISGVRDALSNLAAAHREAVLGTDALLGLAGPSTAEVARLPGGRLRPGDRADVAAFRSLEGLLAGDRDALELVLMEGRPLYGDADLMTALGAPGWPLSVDGRARRLERRLGRRAAALLRAHPGVREVSWAAGLDIDTDERGGLRG